MLLSECSYAHDDDLDQVQNTQSITLVNPITGWNAGSIAFKPVFIKVDWKKSGLRKDIDEFLDKNINWQNFSFDKSLVIEETVWCLKKQIASLNLYHDI